VLLISHKLLVSMASSAANSTCSTKLEIKLTSKQSRRSLHRPVSPYEREKSPVSPTMENNSLLDNSEIKSLLVSIQELRHKKHILNPVFLLYLDACKIYSAIIKGYNPPRGLASDIKDSETRLQIYSLVFEAVQRTSGFDFPLMLVQNLNILLLNMLTLPYHLQLQILHAIRPYHIDMSTVMTMLCINVVCILSPYPPTMILMVIICSYETM